MNSRAFCSIPARNASSSDSFCSAANFLAFFENNWRRAATGHCETSNDRCLLDGTIDFWLNGVVLLRRPPIAAGLAAIAVLGGCNPTPVTINPPRVQQGGRALSIAVASNNDKRMVVATETGGLFRTFDGGASWQHLDGLPNFKTIDVAIASLNPNIIIATTQPQYRAVNDGGIWRSIDGGATWSQPSDWAPASGCEVMASAA